MKNINTLETAELISEVLLESFSETEFITNLKLYDTEPPHVTISWTDGPNRKQVKKLVKLFEGHKSILLDGKDVRFQPEFIFVLRSFSDSFVQSAIDTCCREDIVKPTLKNYRDKKAWDIYSLRRSGNNKQADINEFLNKQGDVTPKKSKTLSRIKWVF